MYVRMCVHACTYIRTIYVCLVGRVSISLGKRKIPFRSQVFGLNFDFWKNGNEETPSPNKLNITTKYPYKMESRHVK